MSFSSHDRAGLRELLRIKLNGEVDGFQDIDLNAMLKNGLDTESRLAATSWQELSEVALLPRVLVQALLEAYNKSALDEPGLQSAGMAAEDCLTFCGADPSTCCTSVYMRLHQLFVIQFCFICRQSRAAAGYGQLELKWSVAVMFGTVL